jgi:predicted AlkP superfamily pyrophosphatase or phosphodiesterase
VHASRLFRLAAAAALLSWTTPAHAAPPPPAPKLVVAISIDQLALDLFQRYRPTFSGGLKRLSGGLVYTGYQSHAATETCPGHSTLLTGMHPSHTGIIGNSWYDRVSGSTVYCVSAAGVADPEAKSSAKLKVDTLGDWLKQARPGGRSIAVSGKDRAAIMMAGHHPDAVYWWSDKLGFVTSPYAGPATPAVLETAKAFNDQRFADWRAQPAQLWPKAIPARCAALQVPHRFGAIELSGRVPPDASNGGALDAQDRAFSDQLRVSPAFDSMTLDFAAQLVSRYELGQGRDQDLLAISLSATDYVGHRYGPGGAEVCVQLDRLDAALGQFLDGLDKLGAPYVVMLSADHGSVDAAERLGPPARRIDVKAVLGELSAALRTEFQLSYDPLRGSDPSELIINLAAADEPRRAAVTTAAVKWLRTRPEVAQAFPSADIAKLRVPRGKPPGQLTLQERFAESYDPERSGDIMVAYAQRASLGAARGTGNAVAGHGSPWDYDRRVPIIFWWPGVAATAKAQPIETVDIAPTLAPLLRISPPPMDGRCIEIGQGCPR